MQWLALSFDELSVAQLYQVMQLRSRVFVVEQDCVYNDLDGKDTQVGVVHLLGFGDDGQLHAYLRALPHGVSYPQVSIGRIVVDPSMRGLELGKNLILQGIELCQTQWPHQDIKIGAQAHLKALYGAFGFEVDSPEYLEDGIPHVDMLLKR
ncbi:GNAT family N-acetyltransferase [Paraferrimonas haliotis]|uniref:ElaA protein n=1 Tax=Paraferrimonas haliotis TaxID=2013866 RepID=A0AA37TPV0_9GAMM|nr:GNAT family N-acetyltransferase [Paraferrimonas haliotis]GLS83453.1 ElaA protein [Paraferrimonas haliotis]